MVQNSFSDIDINSLALPEDNYKIPTGSIQYTATATPPATSSTKMALIIGAVVIGLGIIYMVRNK